MKGLSVAWFSFKDQFIKIKGVRETYELIFAMGMGCPTIIGDALFVTTKTSPRVVTMHDVNKGWMTHCELTQILSCWFRATLVSRTYISPNIFVLVCHFGS